MKSGDWRNENKEVEDLKSGDWTQGNVSGKGSKEIQAPFYFYHYRRIYFFIIKNTKFCLHGISIPEGWTGKEEKSPSEECSGSIDKQVSEFDQHF